MRACADEVIAPHMARMCWPEPRARAVVEPQPSSWLLPLRELQPFATPDPLDSVLVHLPACTLQQRCDPAISVASILTGKCNDGLSQAIFVFAPCRPVALRASGLPQQKARMPLTRATLTGMAHRTAPSSSRSLLPLRSDGADSLPALLGTACLVPS